MMLLLVFLTSGVERTGAQVRQERQAAASGLFSLSSSSWNLYAGYQDEQEAEDEGASEEATDQEPEDDDEEISLKLDSAEEFQDDSGNDPRDFRNKFMPYQRFTELRNGLEVHETVLFGFLAFTPRIGMTYEIPVAKGVYYRDVNQFQQIQDLQNIRNFLGGPLPQPPIPALGGGGPLDQLSSRGYDWGMGDTILRFFLRPEFSDFSVSEWTWGPRKGQSINGNFFMPLLEMTVPTHTEDILGKDEWVLSPGFVFVTDTPTMGFFAMMNFYDFTALRDDDEAYTSRFRGRWFLLQPFAPPGEGLLGGVYLMPELQPIYDVRAGHFSMWVGPELGKVFKTGESTTTVYVKPGWGWAPDAEGSDREFTMEVGVRFFF
ncbi:MAG: hypothetical protein ACYTHJ_05900 [Planctomycetota bacterium]